MVAEEVVQLPIPVNVNVAALGLPLETYDPPAWFRSLEKAWLKSPTPLTFHVSRAPHLVVAVVVFWTWSVCEEGGYPTVGGDSVKTCER